MVIRRLCPVAEQGKQSDYYLKLDTDKAITYGLICDGGLLDKDDNLLNVDVDGYCQIDEHMFDKDAFESGFKGEPVYTG